MNQIKITLAQVSSINLELHTPLKRTGKTGDYLKLITSFQCSAQTIENAKIKAPRLISKHLKASLIC